MKQVVSSGQLGFMYGGWASLAQLRPAGKGMTRGYLGLLPSQRASVSELRVRTLT